MTSADPNHRVSAILRRGADVRRGRTPLLAVPSRQEHEQGGPPVTDQLAIIRSRFDLIVTEKDGLMTVADKAGNDLLTLTLAAAEEVAFKIQFAADHGRLLARATRIESIEQDRRDFEGRMP